MFFLTQTSWINNAYICYYINELPITLLFTISTHFVHFHSSFGKLLDYALSNSSPPSYNIIDHNNTNGGKGWGKVASFIFLHQMPSDLSNLHIEGGKRLCRLKNGNVIETKGHGHEIDEFWIIYWMPLLDRIS